MAAIPPWLAAWLHEAAALGMTAPLHLDAQFAPTTVIHVAPEHWGHGGELATRLGLRFAATWADETATDTLDVYACFEKNDAYLLLRTTVTGDTLELASLTPHCPNADRPERHTRDLFGVHYLGHPDQRRWTRHRAWDETHYPLRSDFPVAGSAPECTPADHHYPFLQAQGSGVYEIPVGPVHAGIIEPGHFRFQAVGEQILNLETRLGYTHKGIEKIAVGRDMDGLIRLAGRVSGDTTVGHAWAACRALEHAAAIEPPQRALTLRALLAERERIANHLWDIAMLCNDIAFVFGFYQLSRVREQVLRLNAQQFGHRLLMDTLIPGGVRHDIDAAASAALLQQTANLLAELPEIFTLILENSSVQDRLVDTGMLTADTAAALGCLGYVGRASGLSFDVRRALHYAPYHQLPIEAAVYHEGDAYARLRVRIDETLHALGLLERLLQRLPAGPIRTVIVKPPRNRAALSSVESWRGEILCYLRWDKNGHVARYYPRDPSALNWPALERLVRGTIVPDFPVCNKSVNGSYAGCDL